MVDKIYYKDHLNFVLDNWYVIKIAFGGNLKDVKYIFAAMSVEEEDQSQEVLNRLEFEM